jgi:protein-arginine kinase activator protein McsA
MDVYTNYVNLTDVRNCANCYQITNKQICPSCKSISKTNYYEHIEKNRSMMNKEIRLYQYVLIYANMVDLTGIEDPECPMWYV